ncbi:hypothetical protein DB347_03110 [Opitutaceae bacterium EW11]|nr:hypothetical protein DB347_03110 [Opitutaceae bacterium EW11]
MLTAYIQAAHVEDPGDEEPAATRERLKDRFPRGATRRMTQLGLLVGSVMEPLAPTENDTLVYASEYAESRALEGFLDSFPSASPTLFQTSIHPSAVQQFLIQRQQAVRTFFPMTGRENLVAHALQVALLADTPRSLVCGGEERGTWLLQNGVASARTFAFSLSLTKEPGNAIGELSLSETDPAPGELNLLRFFQALRDREPLLLNAAPALRLTLSWR